jgi:hypothetical protein
MKAAMAAATITARGLGVAISGMLGGIPGLLTLAGTAFFYFGRDLDDSTKKLKDNEQAISDLRYEYTQFSKIQLTDSISRITGEMKKLQSSIESAKKELANLTSEVVTGDEAMEGLQNVLENTTRDELKQMEDAFADLGIELEIAEEALKNLEEAQNAASRSMTVAEDQTQKAKTAMDKYAESLENAEFEASLFFDKQEMLDEMFRQGKISSDVYTKAIDKLAESVFSADEASTELAESTDTLKESIDGFIDGAKGSWETMWSDLFTGKSTIKTFKDFIDTIETMFLQMLAKIAAQATWDAIFGKLIPGAGSGGGLDIGSIISGIFSKIFKSGSGGAETYIPDLAGNIMLPGGGGGIGSSIMSGLGSIGTAIKNVFSSITSSITTAGTAAGSGFVSSVGSALSAGAGILGPLAIAAFGFAKISKAKKQLKAEFKSLMSDNAITSRLTTEKLVGDYNVLGEHGGRTYVQIGATAAKMYDSVGMWSSKAFGLQRFAMQEMKDEFGNVIIRANNFNELMAILERQEPFVKQAQDLLDLHGPAVIAKEGIELVNGELVRADQAFAQMGQSGVNALMAVNTKSNQYQTIMQKGFVTATQMAQMGLEGFGNMSADVFDIIVRGVQDSEGAMNSLAEAAQIAIDKGRQAASFGGGGGGLQHGGSFIVGGGGGTDSQRVAFMATPGERVTVETPNQQRASGSDGGGVVKELRALRADLANVVAKPIVGAVSRGQLAMAGMGRH